MPFLMVYFSGFKINNMAWSKRKVKVNTFFSETNQDSFYSLSSYTRRSTNNHFPTPYSVSFYVKHNATFILRLILRKTSCYQLLVIFYAFSGLASQRISCSVGRLFYYCCKYIFIYFRWFRNSLRNLTWYLPLFPPSSQPPRNLIKKENERWKREGQERTCGSTVYII